MTTPIREIRVLISCPSDVEPEGQIVREICETMTTAWRGTRNIRITPTHWRRDVIRLITGEGPQAVINSQTKDYDIYIGILWKRFGDKQTNGLTPTEEEFEDALRRREETQKPVIKFFFKRDLWRPDTFYDVQQAGEILKFRERVQRLGLYDEFEGPEEFHQKVLQGLLYIVERFDSLTARRLTIHREAFGEVAFYIPRKALPIGEYERSQGIVNNGSVVFVTALVEQSKRVVLVAGGGLGKTVELQHIAAHFSHLSSPLYPYLITLNKYVNQRIGELLPSEWSQVPESQLLILLDGLDEIESKNRNDALRQIETFSAAHPDAHIVVSCRTNFFKSKTEDWPGTLEGFVSNLLLDLDGESVQAYVRGRLGDRAGTFYDGVYTNQLQDLLNIPFYLIRLVELFEKHHQLPASKSKLFEELLHLRISSDLAHYRTTVDLDEKKESIITELERIALAMEMLGRNYITDDEFQELVSDDEQRALVRLSGSFLKIEGKATTWQFEHNNFQEYLAARALSKQPLEVIKELIS